LSAKNKLAAVMAAQIKDRILVKKHLRIRRDPVEKEKLDMIERDLAPSKNLCTVDIYSGLHETATNADFNKRMSEQLHQVVNSTTPYTKQLRISTP
jgi:hypothetical protein